MELVPVIVLLLSLAQLVVIVLVVRHAFARWRVLDLATRAAAHASPQQAVKMAQLAGAGDLVELEGLAGIVLSVAMKAATPTKR